MRLLGPAGAVGFAAITQENEQLRSMTDELGHRIKNVVAVMQSISRQTMHHTTTKDDFEVRFSGGLGALGRSIDCLMANDWHEARIDEHVRLELTTFGALDGAQFSAEGPAISLQPNARANWSCAARAGNQRLQTWSALGARRQGCRALGACQPWRRTALPHELVRVRWSDGDKTKAPGFRPAGYSAADSAGSKGKGDTRVPTRWRQVETRQLGHFCHQRSQRTHSVH